MKKLNLGCGEKSLRNYINVDIVDMPHVDMVIDLNKTPWPFKDNEIDEIITSHTLEHLDSFHKTIEEIARILKVGGKVKIFVPHGIGWKWLGDPSHKIAFSYRSFNNYSTHNPFSKYSTNFGSNIKFKIIKRRIYFSRNKWLSIPGQLIDLFSNTFPTLYERFLMGIIPSEEIYFELKLIKKN